MPGIVRKLLIFAAVDGLVLQPLAQRGQRPIAASKIIYKDRSIVPHLNESDEDSTVANSFEAFGVVGLLTVSSASYLVSITRRQQVAQIHGKPVYVITEVALTPLSSRKDAEAAVQNTNNGLRKTSLNSNASVDSDSSDDDEIASAAVSDDVDDDNIQRTSTSLQIPLDGSASPIHHRSTSVAEDVISRKGGYGRFAQKWFSKTGWTVASGRNLGLSAAGEETPPELSAGGSNEDLSTAGKAADVLTEAEQSQHAKEAAVGSVAASLLPKLLRTTQLLFGASRSFYFSYDYDITRHVANRKTNLSELPLYKEVDPIFFWNHHLIHPFINAGQHGFVLPLLQGFVGQQTFEVSLRPNSVAKESDGTSTSAMEMTDMAEHDEMGHETVSATGPVTDEPSSREFLLTLISRRSVKRAGLRYLRRGVDEDGHTANSVETEQILSDSEWNPTSKIYSFLQLRGSIPVFFSQSPYSFKPVPQMQHSIDTNFNAFQQHFINTVSRYGDVQVASLVEKHGNEAIVGDAYEKNMKRLNESGGVKGKSVGFEWFDFHAVCRGMKFENVSLLMDALGDKLDAFGNNIEVAGKLEQKQSGILRTNCMDCLDRTNVVQSACARRALELQLKQEGIDLSIQADQTTQWFNFLWADNGDAISKQYASTDALKGQFTRTRKRNYKGALTDMGLSISRFYSGIVNDYFSQAAIDFLLGNVTELVFDDFEANMMSGDPGVSMQKMRQQAIDVSQRLVIADEQEELIGGWTLLTPHEPNTIKSTPFEESVLLLTDAALYACRFDWNMEKVSSFERVDLRHVLRIRYGIYVTSTLSTAQANEARNVGFVISYKVGEQDTTRVNTRSLSSTKTREEDRLSSGAVVPPKIFTGLMGIQPEPKTKILAWKSLPARSAVADGQDASKMSEIEQVKTICAEIERMVTLGQVVESGTERKSIIEESVIISLAEARKSTGILEQLGHSLKKMVWA